MLSFRFTTRIFVICISIVFSSGEFFQLASMIHAHTTLASSHTPKDQSFSAAALAADAKAVLSNEDLVLFERLSLTDDPLLARNLELLLVDAVSYGSLNCVKLLVEHGARPLKKDYSGCSSLCHAITGGHNDICRFLLEGPNNIDVKHYY